MLENRLLDGNLICSRILYSSLTYVDHYFRTPIRGRASLNQDPNMVPIIVKFNLFQSSQTDTAFQLKLTTMMGPMYL